MAQVYKESGRLGNSLVVIPMISIPAITVMGFIYGYIDVYNPAEKIAVLLPFGYGALAGWCVQRAAIRGKCRSRLVLGGLATLAGLLALYVAWVVFIYALLQRFQTTPGPSLYNIIVAPDLLWRIINRVNQSGWFSTSGSTPTGWELWSFWIGEAITIVGFTTIFPLWTFNRVFCEDCNHWCQEHKDLARFKDKLDSTQSARLKGGDLKVLADIPTTTRGVYPFLRLDSQRCHGCNNTATFQVSRVTGLKNKNGKITDSAKVLTKNYLLTSTDLQEFQEALAKTALAQVESQNPPQNSAPEEPTSA